LRLGNFASTILHVGLCYIPIFGVKVYHIPRSK